MIPVFILWAFKKYQVASKVKFYGDRFLKSILRYSKRSIYIILLLFLIAESLKAQNLQYAILKGGATVGVLKYSRNVINNTIVYKAETNVKVRFIFSIAVNAKEESNFKDGVMQYSSVYREVNGHIKANCHTSLNYGTYSIEDKNENEVKALNTYPITGSFLSLYYNEPANNARVYSDSYKTLITIIKLEEHKYKVIMPDGNYNNYYYDKGICTKVEVVHSLYKLVFSLINN
jgi:hypothetical protein